MGTIYLRCYTIHVVWQADNDNFDMAIMVTVVASYGVATISGNLWEYHINCQHLISHLYRFAHAYIIAV